ncbi:hypothetical protein EHI8A_059200 [Entamoeba histolytica HM-1:IMSS-B]|uniref:Uncharacterized protein n=6 Tax=Entamoeba histolytica TaxID=5759 RepID=C4M4M8_ENTH1|nr:hypothetical protein EHI_189440 [Entamoeba histolytica HM-1:IMSS]EMD47630.1 TATA-binding associated phosphoprotein, putative [Entamoeba histolytica KU27]EMH75047.1 hypothetical protein EHI8A_059200 [Entamoeba histolytica HM-1:IMSS-B]EMS15615.1 TATA-binding protein-associated phosphoprotein, putative [Entamoeba histolytica HM-3:IMSS]ENY65369.1 TATA-binding protein-associated phosphoprotein, putative [Entamoeba histolytica HM-1:IMSS-A]GAT96333.1 hypothetical protein CL6EHI_189440 [Entamoeba h|eukprot:XP_651014.1 hypothetical protein EHI_189440 [Entamoeba histolytica HM-1:IMSS]
MRSKGKVLYCYKDKRNEIVFNESLCIAILCTYAEITIRKPAGKASVSKPFFPIETIQFNDSDKVDFENIIDKRVHEIYKMDIANGVLEETALSRMKKNRTTESVHLLFDIVEELGVKFQKKFSNGKNNSLVIDYIESIYFNYFCFKRKDIDHVGSVINSEILSRVDNKQFVTFKKNDTMLISILLDYIQQGHKSL